MIRRRRRRRRRRYGASPLLEGEGSDELTRPEEEF